MEKALEAAKSAMEHIRQLVAAYEVDYDHMEWLRDQRADARRGSDDWTEADEAELAALEKAADGCENADEARRRIEEDALSVRVRSGWEEPGVTLQPAEYEISLSTGGPATRIVGDLDRYGEPASAYVEGQNWGTPWTRLATSRDEEKILLAYARCFYFGGR